MTMQTSNATELADTDIEIDMDERPDAGAPNESPVRDAFDRGVLGREPPHVPLPKDSDVKPDPVVHRHDVPAIDLAREAGSHLDQARGFAAEIARIKTDTAGRLLEAVDPMISKLDAVLEKIEATKLERERAIAATSALYENLPVDPETKKKVQQSAAQKAHDDLMAVRGKELEALALQVVAMAEHVEKQLAFEEAFADDELRTALDGQRRPEERASEDFLVSRFDGQTVAAIAKSYDLMQLDPDLDRVRRFERAALKALEAKVAKHDEVIARGLTKEQSSEKLSVAQSERAAAIKLRDRLTAQRAARTPKSIVHGKAMLANLKTAWQRIAGYDARRGAGVVSADEMAAANMDDSKMAKMRAQAKSWKPMKDWTARHFRGRSK